MKKVKDYGWDCQICCESLPEEKRFHCPSCKEEYCISCFKHYLLNSNEDPHCLHCRTKLLYDQFVETFDKTWRLGAYKKNKEKVLLDKEVALIPATMDYFEKLQRYEKMQKEHERLKKELATLNVNMDDLYYEMQTGRPRERYEYVNGNATGRVLSYQGNRTLTVRTNDVALVKKLSDGIGSLLQTGVNISNYGPNYYVSNLAELRPDLLAAAMKDAKLRAQSIMKATGGKLGAALNVKSGPTQVTSPDSTDTAAGGYYDTSTIDKSISITVTVTFKTK